MKKIFALLLVIVLIISAALLIKKRKQSILNAQVPSPITYTVKTITPAEQPLTQTRLFLAQLLVTESAELSSKLSGQIKEVLVSENQLIKKGDVLVRIDDREIISTIKSLNIIQNANEKEVEYIGNLHDRNKALFKAGGLAREKLDSSEVLYLHKKAALETTKQKIIAAEAQLTYLTITAPFDGIVGTIYMQNGSLAVPGRPLVTINSSTQKLIFKFVPKNPAIAIGQTVVFQDKTIGQVAALYSDADNGLSVAEVSLSQTIDKPNGSYLNIHIVTFSGTGCTVPVNAVLHKKNKTQIMVYENNVFRPVDITIIAQNNSFVMIESCPSFPVAIGAEAKLSLLPTYNKIRVQQGEQDE